MKKHLQILMLCIVSFLQGCSVQQHLDKHKTTKNIEKNIDDIKKDKAYASFSSDTLYDLMAAELALMRQRYDLALGNYLKQAYKTQDVGVTQRAYQLASFIGAKQAALDAALLWTKQTPNNIVALRISAFELLENGLYEHAINNMNKALTLDKTASFEKLANYATALSTTGEEYTQASLVKAINAYPKNSSLPLALIGLKLNSQAYNEALILCNKLLKTDPESTKVIILKGRVLNEMGRSPEAEVMLADAIKRHPNQERLRLLYARTLVSTNQLEQAKIEFEVLIRRLPHNPEIILSLALIYMDLGNENNAEAYFQRLLFLGVKKNYANFYLGKIREKQEKWDDAENYFSAVTPSKHFMVAQIAMARMLNNNSQWPKARKRLESARINYPVQATELYSLEGELLVQRNEYNQALELYTYALKGFPQDVGLLYSRTLVLEKLGRLKKLEIELRKILKLQADHVPSLNALGYMLADQNIDLEEAHQLISKAYHINNSDPAILDSMGWVQYRLGNLKKALLFLQAAYDKFSNGEIAAHLGEVLWQLNRQDEALILWEKALKLDPSQKIIKETINRLSNK